MLGKRGNNSQEAQAHQKTKHYFISHRQAKIFDNRDWNEHDQEICEDVDDGTRQQAVIFVCAAFASNAGPVKVNGTEKSEPWKHDSERSTYRHSKTVEQRKAR
jgi:hypothetical protein